MDGGTMSMSKAEDVLYCVQLVFNRKMAIAGNKNDAVDLLLECVAPIRNEVFTGTSCPIVPKVECVFELSGCEQFVRILQLVELGY
jgi:hypothetical protein